MAGREAMACSMACWFSVTDMWCACVCCARSFDGDFCVRGVEAVLVREVLATFWLRSRRWCGAQLTLWHPVLSLPILSSGLLFKHSHMALEELWDSAEE